MNNTRFHGTRNTKHGTRIAFCVLLIALLPSCASPVPSPTPQVFAPFILVTHDPNASPTPTPFQPSGVVNTNIPTFTSSPFVPPTLTMTSTPAPMPTLTQTPTRTLIPPTDPAPAATQPPPSEPSRTNYILYAALDFESHTLEVEETIRYYNDTGISLADLLLSVQPNQYGGAFVLNSILQDGAGLTSYSLSGQSLTVNLPQFLPAGSATTLTLNFTLDIPAKSSTGLFGYDFNQINLVDWYPFIVPYENGWVLHDPMPFGEHLVYDSSDIELNIKTDPNVIIAAAAPSEANGEWTRYRLYGARTFALSVSDEFLVTESAVGSVAIRSYYFNGYNAAAEGILYAAVQAISLFDVKFAPYPYQSLAVVQADIHDGQEYDGLVFLSSDFYGEYGGGARNNITVIGVHEIAHQWWFGLVGNDQALEPWIDEAMAVYSERIFYEFNYPNSLDWWWRFRVDYFGAAGYVDTSIYNGGTFRTYTNAVYLNGAHFLEDLRLRMGDDDFFRFLKDYAAQYSRRRAGGYDFFAAVRANTSADFSDLLAAYFAGSY